MSTSSSTFSFMGFPTLPPVIQQVKGPLLQGLVWIIALALLIPGLTDGAPDIMAQTTMAIAKPIAMTNEKKIHPIPSYLENWSPSTQQHYFPSIPQLPLGYFIWSDRPVSVYIGPSHFTDQSRKQAWEDGVAKAIVDWQQYFPLKRSTNPNANIVIEQVRPKRTSQGRIRSAQATPKIYCQGDRLTHQFTILISPSQTSRYIAAATRHELGHALGIWGHSDHPEDVMYKAQVNNPPDISMRDINTLKLVYEQPTLLGWPSPKYCPKAKPTPSDSPH